MIFNLEQLRNAEIWSKDLLVLVDFWLIAAKLVSKISIGSGPGMVADKVDCTLLKRHLGYL